MIPFNIFSHKIVGYSGHKVQLCFIISNLAKDINFYLPSLKTFQTYLS